MATQYQLVKRLVRYTDLRSKLMEVLVALKRSASTSSPVPATVVKTPNSAIDAYVEVGPMAVLLMEPAISIPAQAKIDRHAAGKLEIVRGKQRHAFPAPVQGGGDALRSIVYFAEHEIREGKTHERPNLAIVGRQGLIGEVVGPNTSVIQSIHAAHLHIATKLEAVPPAHPRDGIGDDEIVWGIAVAIRWPDG